MRIKEVNENAIIFDNDSEITFDHCQNCWEWNWADFSILNENVIDYDYNFPENLKFKGIEGAGFKFGCPGHWIFIPCYSDQNGYYSDDIDIYFNEKQVLKFSAEERLS